MPTNNWYAARSNYETTCTFSGFHKMYNPISRTLSLLPSTIYQVAMFLNIFFNPHTTTTPLYNGLWKMIGGGIRVIFISLIVIVQLNF